MNVKTDRNERVYEDEGGKMAIAHEICQVMGLCINIFFRGLVTHYSLAVATFENSEILRNCIPLKNLENVNFPVFEIQY